VFVFPRVHVFIV